MSTIDVDDQHTAGEDEVLVVNGTMVNGSVPVKTKDAAGEAAAAVETASTPGEMPEQVREMIEVVPSVRTFVRVWRCKK